MTDLAWICDRLPDGTLTNARLFVADERAAVERNRRDPRFRPLPDLVVLPPAEERALSDLSEGIGYAPDSFVLLDSRRLYDCMRHDDERFPLERGALRDARRSSEEHKRSFASHTNRRTKLMRLRRRARSLQLSAAAKERKLWGTGTLTQAVPRVPK